MAPVDTSPSSVRLECNSSGDNVHQQLRHLSFQIATYLMFVLAQLKLSLLTG